MNWRYYNEVIKPQLLGGFFEDDEFGLKKNDLGARSPANKKRLKTADNDFFFFKSKDFDQIYTLHTGRKSRGYAFLNILDVNDLKGFNLFVFIADLFEAISKCSWSTLF